MAGCGSQGNGGDATGTQRGQEILEATEVSHLNDDEKDMYTPVESSFFFELYNLKISQ